MRDILQLSKEEQDAIAKFVSRKIDVIVTERCSCNVFLLKVGGNVGVHENFDSKEFIEAFTENFWCDECEQYIIDKTANMKTAEMEKAMIEHVMKHLGIE